MIACQSSIDAKYAECTYAEQRIDVAPAMLCPAPRHVQDYVNKLFQCKLVKQ